MSGFWDIVMKVLGWLSIPLFGLSVWLLVRSIRRDTRLRTRTLVLPLATTILVPMIYVAFLRLDPPKVLSGALFLVGLVLGVLWANTTTLTLREGSVFGRRSPWYLVVWGVTFALTQLLALVGTPTLAAWGLSTMYLSVAISIGTNGSLLYRSSRVGAGHADGPIGLPTLSKTRASTEADAT